MVEFIRLATKTKCQKIKVFDLTVKKNDCPEKEQGGRIQNKCISWRPISQMDVEKSYVMLNIN